MFNANKVTNENVKTFKKNSYDDLKLKNFPKSQSLTYSEKLFEIDKVNLEKKFNDKTSLSEQNICIKKKSEKFLRNDFSKKTEVEIINNQNYNKIEKQSFTFKPIFNTKKNSYQKNNQSFPKIFNTEADVEIDKLSKENLKEKLVDNFKSKNKSVDNNFEILVYKNKDEITKVDEIKEEIKIEDELKKENEIKKEDENNLSIEISKNCQFSKNETVKKQSKVNSLTHLSKKINAFNKKSSVSFERNQILSSFSCEEIELAIRSSNKNVEQSLIMQENLNDKIVLNKSNDKLNLVIGQFTIILDRLDYEYRPNDILTGKLNIVVEFGELNLRNLVIYMKGISSVRFTEREYRSNSQTDRHFEDVEYWSDIPLLELKTRPKMSHFNVLKPGEHKIPFKFVLPNDALPSSFESSFGYIRYWIFAEIRSKEKIRDSKEYKEAREKNEEIQNIATSELTVEIYTACTVPIEELKRSVNSEQLKITGCCHCLFRNPDFIQVRANIMHQGQLRGSSVQVNLFIVNRSRKNITPKVFLKIRNEFKATNKVKMNETELIGCTGDIVKSGEVVMQSILLPLSYDLPIIYDSPNIIISYRIKITIDIPKAFDMFIHLPILLTNEKFLTHNQCK